MNWAQINSIYIETFCHATESLQKVKEALLNLFDIDVAVLPEELNIEEARVYGGYGNDIIILKSTISSDALSAQIFNNLTTRVSLEDKVSLYHNFERQTDGKRSVFLRFNKQAAYQGIPMFASEDPIMVQIHFDLGFTRKKELAAKLREHCMNIHFIESGE